MGVLRGSHLRWWSLSAGFAAYAGLRVWMFAAATPLMTPDSRAYLRLARESFLSTRFFSEYKPWFVPAFYKLFAGSPSVATWAQLALSILAWTVLALELARIVPRRWLRFGAGVAILLMSLSPVVAQWDAAVLSESLSLSLGALLVALLIRVQQNPSSRGAFAVAILAFLWAGTRDTNSYLVALLLPALALICCFRHRYRVGIVFVAAAIVVVAFSLWSTSSPRRWEIISTDVVVERVLGDPTANAYFSAHGMPEPPDLRRRLFSDRTSAARFAGDRPLAPFRAWLRARSRQTYIAYLLHTPSASLGVPLGRLGQLNSADAIPAYRPHGFKAIPLSFLFGAGGLAMLWSCVAAAGVVATYRGGRETFGGVGNWA